MKVGRLFRGFIEKLRDNRKLELFVYALLLSAAIIIILSTGGISCFGKANSLSAPQTADSLSGAEEEELLERRLEAILSELNGAGEVRVMITFEYVSDTGAETSARRIGGVVVIAEGADSIRVKTDLTNAAAAALGVDHARISVFSMKK